MAEIEDENGSDDGGVQDLIEALRSDDQFKRLTSGKGRRTPEQAALCIAVRKIASDRCGDWPRFLTREAEIDGAPPLSKEKLDSKRKKISADVNGRTGSHPYPKREVVARILRVALHDAARRERDAALAPVRTLWKLVTGEDLDLPAEGRHRSTHASEIAAGGAKRPPKAGAGAHRRAEEQADADDAPLLDSAGHVEVLTARIKELELRIRQVNEERDAERRTARAAQDRLRALTREHRVLTRRSERDRILADARAERIARLVAVCVAGGRPIEWTDLSRIGLQLKIFPGADRNHQAICAYLQTRWQILRHYKEAPTPLPPGVNAEMVDRAYRGQGALLAWPQFVSVVESIGGQLSFLTPLYNAVKAQETPVDPLDANVIATMGPAQIQGLADEVGPGATTEDRPGPQARLRRFSASFLPRWGKGRGETDLAAGRARPNERPDRSSLVSKWRVRRENATQRHLYL